MFYNLKWECGLSPAPKCIVNINSKFLSINRIMNKQYSGFNFGVGNGNPLQCFCLENSMDGGAWQAAVHGVHRESDTTE